MIEVNKKEGESASNLFFRFTKKIRRSGVLIEVRKRRFYSKDANKRSVRGSAKHRGDKAKEIGRLKKLGLSS